MSLDHKKDEAKDLKGTAKPKKKSIWEEVISDVSKSNEIQDSHILLLGFYYTRHN